MELSKIENLPLFMRLGSFKENQKARLKQNCNKISTVYSTKHYIKRKLQKPIIL